MAEDEALISQSDIADRAGLTTAAVSNWRRRFRDFPSPVQETGAVALFRQADVQRWMSRHGKRFDTPSVDQLVRSALNRTRGTVRPEEAAEAGMILLGYLALALQLNEDEPAALRSAIDAHPPMLEEHLWRLARKAERLGLAEAFTPDAQPSLWVDSGSFLSEVADLAQAYGVAEVFEALLAAAARGSRGTGESTTPSSIAELIISLVAPTTGTVVDLACGQGTLLLAAGQKATAPPTLIGQDVNAAACHITRLRMFVHGLPAHVVQGDSLTGDSLPNVQGDLVVTDPGFGMYWNPGRAWAQERFRFGVPPRSRADLAWVQVGISKLRPNGLAMIILPLGSLSRGGTEGEIRRGLIEARCVQAVITLPSGLYPTTSTQVALWIMRRPGQRDNEGVLLLDASRLGSRVQGRTELTDADIAAIESCVRTWRQRGEVPGHGILRATTVPVSSLLERGGVLNPVHWIKDRAEDPEQLLTRVNIAKGDLDAAGAAFGRAAFSIPRLRSEEHQANDGQATRKISDLTTLIRPRRIDPDVIGTGSTPLIRPKDLGPDLAVTPSEQVDLKLVGGRVELTRPGDVLVIADGSRLRAGVDHVGGAAVSAPLVILRPRADSMDSIVLAALITSIAPRHAVGTAVKNADLPAMQIPYPDMRTTRWLAKALNALGEQRRQALAAVQAINEIRTDLIQGLSSQALMLPEALDEEEQ
jgi:type I restriction-modification system DNA methylase subunit